MWLGKVLGKFLAHCIVQNFRSGKLAVTAVQKNFGRKGIIDGLAALHRKSARVKTIKLGQFGCELKTFLSSKFCVLCSYVAI